MGNLYPTGVIGPDPAEPSLPEREIDRRTFFRVAGGSLVAASAVLSGCDPVDPEPLPKPQPPRVFFADDFARTAEGWGDSWLNVRYAGAWSTADAGIVEVGPATPKAIAPNKLHTEYMARPILHDAVATDVEVEAELSVDGGVEAGVVARASYDEGYALLLSGDEALLCRYRPTDRRILARARLPRSRRGRAGIGAGLRLGDTRLVLRVAGGDLTGRIEGADGAVSLRGRDPNPLGAGLVGVVVNPISAVHGGRVAFAHFRATTADRHAPPDRIPSLMYGFTGAVVTDGSASYRARVTARTAIPQDIAFEVARDAAFSDATRTPALPPHGDLGAVHTWLEDLAPDTVYFWRPVAGIGPGTVRGATTRFTTPPGPGAPVRFCFASCTSGRVAAYPSFATARSMHPDFFLHAGDWGYADLTAVAHSPDHFQSRWVRLLRAEAVAGLVSETPLLFWQDDHDYQADNGWARTVPAYAVRAFDELHANPAHDYFDLRWGDAHVWCLNCREHASDPKAPDGPRKTRVGARQKAWLKEGMRASDAPLQVVASPMVFRNKSPDDPGWHNVYAHERDELLAFFAGLDSTVVILSGDSHGQRLIHHFEFGDLYEFNCAGTDFPEGGQGNHDPEHTLVNLSSRSGFAFVDLDPDGPGRAVTVSSIASHDGSVLFRKSLPVGG